MASSRIVMLVSRHPADQDFYTRLLRDFNLLSVPVSAPHEAVRRLAHFRVSALLLHLSEVDSTSGFRNIVAAAHPAPVLVIAPLAMHGDSALQRALDDGCADIIAEPCSPQSVAERLWRAIGGNGSGSRQAPA
jgi:CheY-like chemotaxis protein